MLIKKTRMKIDVLLGLQWGDEGKGKIVDVLSTRYDVIARFQGGPNAGHSLEFNNIKHVLHTIPSGVFRENTLNLIGNGVVIDPAAFTEEIEALEKLGIDLSMRLLISKKTHLILPTHRILDAASEKAKGKTKIGSTLRGIGPAYMDKTGRNGLRIGDLISGNFEKKYNELKAKHERMLKNLDFEYDISEYEKKWLEGIEVIRKFQLVDGEYMINKWLREGKKILAEGAQGTLLDIEYGTYPYVTSSHTVTAGVCIGLGVAPAKIGNVFGIFKAYITRVGSGPFPTELFDANGEKLQKEGHEYGATTGRPRRCGWLDLPALKYAVMINGVTHLVMTKADVLNNFVSFSAAVKYSVEGGKASDEMPFDMNSNIKPVYRQFDGWGTMNIDTTADKLPQQFADYVKFIENYTGAKIAIVSVGPKRIETIFLDENK